MKCIGNAVSGELRCFLWMLKAQLLSELKFVQLGVVMMATQSNSYLPSPKATVDLHRHKRAGNWH